ncbi:MULTISPECIES: site-specific integrase [Sphingobacterium]|uniref:Tyrosine-type recombinase/integrase n=1 Tax=Sphingobacterium tenebrionis TaxID=3111775 RepID=A0ABU8I407_9SPHI|nr:site-specific integrase [Sphingobacterium sp. CZ-2]QBR11487.1 hypothetical protein E3D81_04575 [Sphingobacterium sp. CZ-2]
MTIPKIYLKRRSNEKDGQLWLYYSHGSDKRLEYYTGLRIENQFYNEKYWLSNTKKPIMKGFMYSHQYNKKLEEMKSFAVTLVINEKIHDNDELKKRITKEFRVEKISQSKFPSTESLTDQKDINQPNFGSVDFISYCEFVQAERISGKRPIISGNRQGLNYKYNSLKNPSTTISSLKEYVKYKRIKQLSFNDINVAFYNDYRNYLLNVKKKKISTFSTRVRDIKAFMNEGIDDKLHQNTGHKNKRFIAPKYESTGIALTLEEIRTIQDADIDKYYHHVRDLFLIGCYTALRFSDYSSLELVEIDDSFIRLKQSKTNNRVSIPIMKGLKEILSRYNNKLPPPCSNQHFNRTIKKICSLSEIGLDRVYEIDKYGNKIMWSSKVTSHTGRRSYATNMFKLGVPTILIMSATGHKKEEMFLRYIKATNEEKTRMLADWMEKLDI